ncbi:uncharacterized protein [Canis lupus baileyi]|uniref:uncharacterized protein isoform X2 n=1 Tax=Canis lupus baileyi TaxID=143281 RepID=UPI003B977B8F
MKHHKTRCLELSGSEETGRGRKTFQGRGAAKWGIKATSDCDLERRRRRKMEFLKHLDSTREQRTMMCNLFLLLQRYYRHIAVGNLVSWWNTNSKSNICHHHHHMTSHVTSISTEDDCGRRGRSRRTRELADKALTSINLCSSDKLHCPVLQILMEKAERA